MLTKDQALTSAIEMLHHIKSGGSYSTVEYIERLQAIEQAADPALAARWNTGRLYTSDGQIITAVLHRPTGVVHFYDQSRHVGGYFVAAYFPTTADALSRLVMTEYDNNRYKILRRAEEQRLLELDLPIQPSFGW